MMKKAKPLGGLMAVLLAVGGGCTRQEKSGPDAAGGRAGAATQPNVLLVTFDTTRADHLAPFGAKFAFNPTLNALAKRSFKFTRAFSSVPLTLPSHATIMTGLYPFYHGVHMNGLFVLQPEARTLAEVLRDAGYQTLAVVAAYVLDGRFGLDQGFDVYDDEVRPFNEFATFAVPERNAAAVTDRALELLEKTTTERPYFLWAHYYDPHAQYDAPESFTRFQGHPYDVEIAYADMELGRLLQAVEARDVARGQKTLIVFTSDHGESLGEYGEPTHGYFAYDSTLHVPLLVAMPDGSSAGGSSAAVVSLADILPTVTDVLGVTGPASEALHGLSLRPLIEGRADEAAFRDRAIGLESLDGHYNYGWARLQGVRVGETKYLDQPTPELYVLDENPREGKARNVQASRPDLAGQMQAAYRELYEARLAVAPLEPEAQAPDAEITERLSALGYVTTVPMAEDPRRALDLKEMLAVHTGVAEAMGYIGAGDVTRALENLQVLLARDPGNPRILWILGDQAATVPWIAGDVVPVLEQALEKGQVPPQLVPGLWVNMGRAALNRGDERAALALFEQARAAEEQNPLAHTGVALSLVRLGRLEEAVAALAPWAESADAKAGKTKALLGLLAHAAGQTELGARVWAQCVEAVPPRLQAAALASVAPRDLPTAKVLAPALEPRLRDTALPAEQRLALGIVLADLEALRGAHERAAEILEAALPLGAADDIDLRLSLAREYRQLGRLAQARELVQKCHAQAPRRPDVVTALARLHLDAQEVDAALELLSGFAGANPGNPEVSNDLAWLLARRGTELDRALALARDARRKRPGSAVVQDTLAAVYAARRDHDRAAIHLDMATRMDPQNADYHLRLGRELKALSRAAEARAAFARAVELAPSPSPDWYDEAVRAANEP